MDFALVETLAAEFGQHPSTTVIYVETDRARELLDGDPLFVEQAAGAGLTRRVQKPRELRR